MKNLTRSTALLLGAFLTVQSANLAFAANTGDASAVNMKIYKLWVSEHTDCSNAVLVYSNNNPTAQNMINNPTLGSGSVVNGTYPCIAFKMDDHITGKPNYTSTGGHCTPSTNIEADVFRADNQSESVCPDGSTISGSAAEDDPCLFMSTTGLDSNTGWTAGSPFPLTAPLVVSGDKVGTFIADFRGKIEDAYNECGIQPPVFGFR